MKQDFASWGCGLTPERALRRAKRYVRPSRTLEPRHARSKFSARRLSLVDLTSLLYPEFMRFIAVLVLALSLSCVSARADEVYTFVVKKQEEKAKTRWSLAEWIDTRDRMRLMDLWLALHSPSPFEFFVSAESRFGPSATKAREQSWALAAAAYASIFGLEVQKGFAPDSHLIGLFHLRIFGYHAQATNITLQAGIRSRDVGETQRNAVAGVGMSIYLARYFGLDGLYQHHFQSVPSASGARVSGDLFQGGAFIDFKFLRLFANYFSAPQTVTLSGASSEVSRTGFSVGTKLYF